MIKGVLKTVAVPGLQRGAFLVAGGKILLPASEDGMVVGKGRVMGNEGGVWRKRRRD
jgi:hypothetical protein